jgi:nicotinate-nucleotide pyrophosphorylase
MLPLSLARISIRYHDLISIGWLTHRAAILDIGLDVEA